jgi:glycosyltransferase involved in cell wall biosynthesis
MAREFPEYNFSLVGDSLFQCGLPNVKVIGKINSLMLKELFNQHQFYLQLSLSEGFPNALAEAMLCGCVPIGSSVGAIPEIIGKCGFILERKDPIQLKKIFQSLNSHNLTHLRYEASSHIQNKFSYSKRQKALLSLFAET